MRIKWGLNGVYLTSSIILNFLMVLTEKCNGVNWKMKIGEVKWDGEKFWTQVVNF